LVFGERSNCFRGIKEEQFRDRDGCGIAMLPFIPILGIPLRGTSRSPFWDTPAGHKQVPSGGKIKHGKLILRRVTIL